MKMYEKKNELYHHGVKGQRWGVRRYQNSDGTLTDLGRKRSDARNKLIANGEKTLPKGTVFTRWATPGEPLDDKRKYVAYDPEDVDSYREYARWGELGFNPDETGITKYEYEAKRALTVASGRKVMDYLLSICGDENVAKIHQKGHWTHEQADALHLFIRRNMYKKIDDIVNFFGDKGYDVIEDIEDSRYMKSASILVDPKRNVKLKSAEMYREPKR